MICRPGILRDHVIETFLAIVRSGRARRSFQFDDLALAARRLHEPVGGALPLVDEVRTNERDVVAARLRHRLIHVAVDQDHGNACFLGLQHDRRKRLFFTRREHDQIDVLRNHALDIGDLFRCRAVGIGHDHLPAALCSHVLEALGFGETPRVVAFGLRKTDAQRFFGRQLRQGRVVSVCNAECRRHRQREHGRGEHAERGLACFQVFKRQHVFLRYGWSCFFKYVGPAVSCSFCVLLAPSQKSRSATIIPPHFIIGQSLILLIAGCFASVNTLTDARSTSGPSSFTTRRRTGAPAARLCSSCSSVSTAHRPSS